MPEEMLKAIIGKEDIDGNGNLEYIEFSKWLKRDAVDELELSTLEQEVKEVFSVLDSNGDGYLSTEDLQSLVTDVKEANQMIQEQDIDGDNRINYEEFVLLMSSK